jgi:hypothetical protein
MNILEGIDPDNQVRIKMTRAGNCSSQLGVHVRIPSSKATYHFWSNISVDQNDIADFLDTLALNLWFDLTLFFFTFGLAYNLANFIMQFFLPNGLPRIRLPPRNIDMYNQSKDEVLSEEMMTSQVEMFCIVCYQRKK